MGKAADIRIGQNLIVVVIDESILQRVDIREDGEQEQQGEKPAPVSAEWRLLLRVLSGNPAVGSGQVRVQEQRHRVRPPLCRHVRRTLGRVGQAKAGVLPSLRE